MCKYNEHCSGGAIEINGIFMGRCECKHQEFMEFFYEWSGAKNEHKRLKNQLETYNIDFYTNSLKYEKETVNYLKEMEFIIENKEKFINDGVRIILKGIPESGKTQWATTVAWEILGTMDLTPVEMKYDRFLFISIKDLVYNQKKNLYNQSYMEEISEKVALSKVLLIDDM
ncbi:hypothetical protein [Neobacillus soli]|uniref:hypothetical protein n=1 Tax=Neobacillus soli TaxID=220688 RepID=UPI00082428B4|nr:hypothetical protein [Neobacillus soli]